MKKTLCQHCGVKPATVFYRENKNGVRRELQLCPECAANMGIGELQDPFSSAFSLFSHSTPAKKEAACPLCGTTLSQIRRDGTFGCSRCYDTFANMLDLSPYVGTGYKLTDANPPKARPSAPDTPPKQDKDELSTLKQELKNAVDAEDYERAAVLRDKIRAKEGA